MQLQYSRIQMHVRACDSYIMATSSMPSKLLVTFSIVMAAVLVTAVQGTPAGSGSTTESTASGKLNLILVTYEAIEGEYYGSDDLAIRFLSNEERVSISTFGYGERSAEAEKHLLDLARPPELENARMMNILGAEVLYFNTTVDGESKIVEFFVPHRYKARVTSAINSHNLAKLHRVTKKLHRDRNSIERAAKKMLEDPAMLLLQEAMFAMGANGLQGRENPAALKLYIAAMRLLEWRGRVLGDDGSRELEEDGSRELEEDGSREPEQNDYFAALQRQKRSHCQRCHSGTCPDEYHRRNCLGLCGKGCSCWSWVCGDCCYQQGCYEHDVCCGYCGYFSWTCLNVWGFWNWCDDHFYRFPQCTRDCR